MYVIYKVNGCLFKVVLMDFVFWLVLALFSGLVVGFCSHVVLVWFIRREALSIMNRNKQAIGQEKKQTTKLEKVAMIGELKEVLDAPGEIKEKLTKVVGIAANHPDATEDLFKTLRKFI